MNEYISREAFLQPARRRFKDVTLPVSEHRVRIRSLMEGEKEAYEAETLNKKGGLRQDRILDARRRLVVLCLVDGNGDLLLTSGDSEALKQLDGADMACLQDECSVHCGFKEGDIEGLVKNSDAVPVAVSPTD